VVIWEQSHQPVVYQLVRYSNLVVQKIFVCSIEGRNVGSLSREAQAEGMFVRTVSVCRRVRGPRTLKDECCSLSFSGYKGVLSINNGQRSVKVAELRNRVARREHSQVVWRLPELLLDLAPQNPSNTICSR
jgi:hypothetical protein